MVRRGWPRVRGTRYATTGGPSRDKKSRPARKKENRMKKNALIVLFALLFAPLFLHAQGLGSIVGRVTDPAGAPVAGAQVTATQVGTGFSRNAMTDTEGLYVIPSLQPATYSLAVEAKGFSISKESGITLLADQTLNVNMSLKLGLTTGVVTVTSNTLEVALAAFSLKHA